MLWYSQLVTFSGWQVQYLPTYIQVGSIDLGHKRGQNFVYRSRMKKSPAHICDIAHTPGKLTDKGSARQFS